MNELQMQQLMIDAVQEPVKGGGGFARKLSNRFMVGVVDLIVKPSNYQASVVEVKRFDFVNWDVNREFPLDVSGPQKRFLRDAHKAGMPCGVASFMQKKREGVKGLHLAMYSYKMIESRGYIATMGEHSSLGGPSERLSTIRDIITSFYQECCDNDD